MSDLALHPESMEIPTLDAEPIQVVEAQVVETSTQDDKELAALNMSRGWQRIATEMNTDIDILRNMTASDLKGLSREEIGDKYLISSIVADHLQRYLDQVDHATKAVVENEKRTTRN